MNKLHSILLLVFLLTRVGFAQQTPIHSVIQKYFEAEDASLSSKDRKTEWEITDIVPSLNPHIKHVYAQQFLDGIPIQYATYKFTIKKNNIISWYIDQFVKNPKEKVIASQARISAAQAVTSVLQRHRLAAQGLNKTKVNNKKESYRFTASGITLEKSPIISEKVFFKTKNKLQAAWRVNLHEKSGNHWWNTFVAADSGKILAEEDWVIHCNFGKGNSCNSSKHKPILKSQNTQNALDPIVSRMNSPTYRVLPTPVESPIHGNSRTVTNPANTTASPFGWHDTNGRPGIEHTITRGNNVWAMEDQNGNNGIGYSPDGGDNLSFDFRADFSQNPREYLDASITNLFYWNNITHDVFYQYGFDEASGNFQENNYGKGGRGGDGIMAETQDGSATNNANITVPNDGGNPRMQMFLWSRTRPNRDSSFDNAIIVHEYGHGISIRLVGGPSVNVLGGSEQMGEGWSDWFGMMLTMRSSDFARQRRGVGSYVMGQNTDGRGIRPTPYSTSRSINNTDYSDIDSLSVPHGVGYAFATILWDMTWALIAQEGFDPDLYKGKGGNNIALKLVVEGLKNTANNPGFVSGREGILQADKDLFQGKYQCLIWKAFADRGVGKDAVENANGGSNGKNDQIVSFTNPCTDLPPPPPPAESCREVVTAYPYNENFENTFGLWTQSTADDLDWELNTNATPSNGTGPDEASDGRWYIYTEASGEGNTPGKKATILSPCFDLSTVSNPELSFRYHLLGEAIGKLEVDMKPENSNSWTRIFERSANQGVFWKSALIDLSQYEGNRMQFRVTAITGRYWQSDVAVDQFRIAGNSDPTQACTVLQFNSESLFPFSNQDLSGDSAISNNGKSLTLRNNTWKYIPFDYVVKPDTMLEFSFVSQVEGEIHGIGFENDNTITASQHFKVHGTQNHGILAFDDYRSGTKNYKIPVGTFFTGAIDRLVFINDKDSGSSGNHSTFSNVAIYEGNCNRQNATNITFAEASNLSYKNKIDKLQTFRIWPNPAKDTFALVLDQNKGATQAIEIEIFDLIGNLRIRQSIQTTQELWVKQLGLQAGIYMVKINYEGASNMLKLVVK